LIWKVFPDVDRVTNHRRHVSIPLLFDLCLDEKRSRLHVITPSMPRGSVNQFDPCLEYELGAPSQVAIVRFPGKIKELVYTNIRLNGCIFSLPLVSPPPMSKVSKVPKFVFSAQLASPENVRPHSAIVYRSSTFFLFTADGNRVELKCLFSVQQDFFKFLLGLGSLTNRVPPLRVTFALSPPLTPLLSWLPRKN